ncbi:hypothetical protein F4813DRAFT_401304 [Daldinia decipiens]|uniref:uncharacterized protein n=1 Tax=Daldinia decipiens TaxID=326647 RepID=UPI0020C3712C|nr:uncharacterized protein F4813DRAFT_401304 [Daldinia decipiens]KAI1659696.1 hypothetical protein F4813DRAFT_401304 [Daldinia decipiens]
MSGLPTGSEFIKYCTCEACSYGLKGQCEVSRELFEHTQVVATILANGSQRMIAIGYGVRRERHHVTCHASLLCYWSPVIKKAIERSRKPVSAFWISFGENGRRAIMIWKQIIQWCYVGRLMDPSDVSDATIGHNSDIEALWNAAITLEMHELANYCLRLIVIKYTWGLGVRSDTRFEFNPRDCPFDAAGLYEVFIQNQRGYLYRKLLGFMEDLLTVRGPLTPGAMEHVSPAAMQKWTDLMHRHPRFCEWINNLGGLEHNNQNAVLPTHFNQWAKYRVPVMSKVPANVQDWVDENKELLEKEGESVTLMAMWQRHGDGETASDRWEFYRVRPRRPIGQE